MLPFAITISATYFHYILIHFSLAWKLIFFYKPYDIRFSMYFLSYTSSKALSSIPFLPALSSREPFDAPSADAYTASYAYAALHHCAHYLPGAMEDGMLPVGAHAWLTRQLAAHHFH